MHDLPETAYYAYIGNIYVGVFDEIGPAVRAMGENDTSITHNYTLYDVRSRKAINFNWKDYY